MGVEAISKRRHKIVVVGDTSTVGAAASRELSRQGHEVRGVTRAGGIPFCDQLALNRAFDGADSAYVMIPFDAAAEDPHEFERDTGERIATAISLGGVQRVVQLSGLNAHLKMGTSLGAAVMEERLALMGLPELVFLRAAFFYENFVKGMDFAAQAVAGSFASPFRGDLPMPMIAASDIGVRVAKILTTSNWPADRVVELHGNGSHTFQEATAILATAMRRPVTYQHTDFAGAMGRMLASGISEAFAQSIIETAASFNRGERWALEQPSERNNTPTSMSAWAERTFALHRTEEIINA